MNKKINCLVGISALVLGNLIGAGILALPISLGLSGLFPSLLVMLVYGALMYYSADVLARESVEQRSESFDYPSLYGKYLGPVGKWLAVITNAIILYGLMIAYISGGAQVIANLLGLDSPPFWLSLAFALLLSLFTMLDLSVINKYNTVLVLGLLLSFVGLIIVSAPHITPKNLGICQWRYTPIAIPLAVTACHFHNIIPTLCGDVKWDLSIMRKAMIIGMILAVIMNIAWVTCGIGCLPRHGEESLVAAYTESIPATVPMSNILQSGLFTVLIATFSLVAIATSFLANGVGLLNFINDLLFNSLKIKNLTITRVVTFVPPIVIAMLWPSIFIKALDVVGGIGIVTLFGVLPCTIAVIKKTNSRQYRTYGGIFLIFSAIALFMVVAGLCGNKLCKPDPNEIECSVEHEGQKFEIYNPRAKKIYRGTSNMFPEVPKSPAKTKTRKQE